MSINLGPQSSDMKYFKPNMHDPFRAHGLSVNVDVVVSFCMGCIVDTWEGGGDRKTTAQREREYNHFLVLYDMKQVQAAEKSQRRTAVSSKCFHLHYTRSDRLLTIALPSCSFHLFSPLTVTFRKLPVILRPLYKLRLEA
jgi:hypothetical protein